ncbi:MAG: V-type ATPase subunit [Candidatus Krumholzibacteria bacterium]|nr:V-type ATPase subunit [Candidatus Krumholzibacteria bacterium]
MAADYTYLVARLRAIESQMPDRAWYLRLARTPAPQLLAAVRERFPAFEGVDAVHDFERGIEAERAESRRLLRSLVADRDALLFLLAGDDFDNCVQAWKGRMTGAEAVLEPSGLASPRAISAAVESGDASGLPPWLKELHGSLAAMAGEATPAELDYAGENAKWDFLLRVAPGRGARDWARLRIDLANIKNFVRLRRSSLRPDPPAAVWIAGGTIEASRLARLFGEPLDEFFSMLASTRWHSLRASGFDAQVPAGLIDPILLGRLLDLLGDARLRFFDLSPVLYSIELRERAWTALRLVFVGAINRLPEEILAGKVEELYG